MVLGTLNTIFVTRTQADLGVTTITPTLGVTVPAMAALRASAPAMATRDPTGMTAGELAPATAEPLTPGTLALELVVTPVLVQARAFRARAQATVATPVSLTSVILAAAIPVQVAALPGLALAAVPAAEARTSLALAPEQAEAPTGRALVLVPVADLASQAREQVPVRALLEQEQEQVPASKAQSSFLKGLALFSPRPLSGGIGGFLIPEKGHIRNECERRPSEEGESDEALAWLLRRPHPRRGKRPNVDAPS